MYALAVKACRVPGATDALDGDKLRAFPFRQRPPTRIYQFDRSRGVVGFPDKPQDALKAFDRATLKTIEVIWKCLQTIRKILASALSRAIRIIVRMSVLRKITI